MRWFEPVERPVQRQADLSNPLEASELGRRRAPLVGLLLGYGAIAPLALGAAAALLISRGELQAAITRLTLIWGAAILIFLAGVRRGLSFAMPGGAPFGEIASSLFLFALGAASLLPPAPSAAAALLILGYASVGALDARAARQREAPPYFARLRPAQAALAVASLAALLVRSLA